MLKLYSWNVNGIRAVEKKGFLNWLHTEKPDVLGIQETKAHVDQLSQAVLHPDQYESYWSSGVRRGYSGTAVFTRVSPILCMTDFGHLALDGEGRIVMLEFEKFFYFNVYFPNGGSGEERLQYKLRFYDEFLKLVESFRKQKPIVICGDVNTAHKPEDLARPKENANTSGFMAIERDWLDKLESHGYIDAFRLFHEGNGYYSWWDMKTRSREKNVGWRIDHFWVSTELKKHIVSADIHPDVLGSDHCPISLKLSL
ncbi:MAG: exodeoxyribonuclease III [bacterium]